MNSTICPRLCLLASMIGGTGCSADSLPTPDEAASAALLVLAPPSASDPLLIWAYDTDDPTDPPPRFTLIDGARAAVALYDEPLSELGLAPGRVPSAVRPDARGLAPFSRFLELKEGDEWVATPLLPPFDQALLPATSPQTCVAAGGCYADEDGATRGICAVPCPFDDEIESPEAVTPPAPPRIDWTPTPDAPCGTHEAQWVDSLGCEPVQACPTPPGFPQDLPPDTIYVATGGMGDGTEQTPYGSVTEALAAASPGMTVAVLGDHLQPISIVDGIRLVGACPERSRVGRVLVGGQTDIQGMTIGVGANVELLNGAELNLRDSIVSAPFGVLVFGGELRAQRVLFKSDVVRVATSVDLEEVAFEGGATALELLPSSQANLRRVRMRRCFSCVSASDAGMTMDRVSVSTATRAISANRTTGTLTDVALRSLRGGAISWVFGALTLERVTISDVGHFGAALADGDFSLTDVAIDGVRRDGQDENGYGVWTSGTTTVQRLDVRNTYAAAVVLAGEIDASDVTARDISNGRLAGANNRSASGVVVLQDSTGTLARAQVDNAERGFDLIAPIAASDLSTSTLTTDLGDDGAPRDGVGVRLEDRARIERLRVAGAEGAGIHVNDADADAFLSDVSIHGPGGWAVIVGVGHIDIDRLNIDATDNGFCLDRNGTAKASNARIAHIDGGAYRCPRGRVTPSAAVAVDVEGHLDLQNFLIEEGAGPGITVAEPDTFRLRDGRIRAQSVGAQVEVTPEAFDLGPLLIRVFYTDNGIDLLQQ